MSRSRYSVLALPTAVWFLLFLLVPLLIVLFYSVCTKGVYGGIIHELTLENYARASDHLYFKIFRSSLELAAATTVSCLLIGYPMAYAMATAPARFRNSLLVLVVIPFWTNLVVRTYGLKNLLSELGPVNQVLLSLHLINEPFVFANTTFAVWFGMVTNYLPFMILPLYVTLEKFDFTLLEAAKDLGAPPWRAFAKVLIPLTRRGIISGCIFVFTPALGEFVIPDLLGGAKTMLMGNLITDQFLKARDWPFGSALSLLLIVFVMLSLSVYLKIENAEEA